MYKPVIPGSARLPYDSRRALAAGLRWALVLMASASFCPSAGADGLAVWRNEDIREPEQKALIYFHDGVEDLVLSVRFEGAPEEFGWIVPVPAEPTLFAEDESIFKHLSTATQGRQSHSRAGSGSHDHMLGVSDVGILSTDTVGIYRTQVLQAAGGEALAAWLKTTGYRLPPGGSKILDRYVRDGWVFATLKILNGSADSLNAKRLADGTIQPVRFRFAAREPIFPLEISSLGQGGSDILLYVLAPEVLVPRVPSSDFWDTKIFSAPGEQRWIDDYEKETNLERFLPGRQDPFRLTKSRARFAPTQMRDVTFGPLDPVPHLLHGDSGKRQEAVTHLGFTRPPGAEELLTAFLDRARPGAETYCTLWALGEVGGERAEEALLRYAEDPSPTTRLEALAALGRMGSHRAVPLFVRGLASARDGWYARSDGGSQAIQDVCFESLVRLGDSSCVSSLQSLAESNGGWSAWVECGWGTPQAWRFGNAPQEPDPYRSPGVLALAALAALGQEEAFQVLLGAVVRGGAVTGHEDLQAAAARSHPTVARGKTDLSGFPSGFWTGLVLLDPTQTTTHWPAVDWIERLFAFAPEYRDPLYRACAADPRMPPAGAVALLGSLQAPEEADFDRLRRIGAAALRPPVLTIDIRDAPRAPRRAPRPDAPAVGEADSIPNARFNYVACAVAYAFGRHNRVDDLISLYEIAPANDSVLRGEIVFAMARQRDPRFRDMAFEYIRDVCDATATGEAFATWLRDVEGQPKLRSTWPYDSPIDMPYRRECIFMYVMDAQLHGGAATTLVCDRSLSPYLRLMLMRHASITDQGWTYSSAMALRAEAERIMEVDGTRDPLLRRMAAEEIWFFERRLAWAAHRPYRTFPSRNGTS